MRRSWTVQEIGYSFFLFLEIEKDFPLMESKRIQYLQWFETLHNVITSDKLSLLEVIKR